MPFTIDSGVDVAKRGTTVANITVDDGDAVISNMPVSVLAGFSINTDAGISHQFQITHTGNGEGGVATGTKLKVGDVVGISGGVTYKAEDIGAVGYIAVGIDSGATTRYGFLVQAKAAIEANVAFGTSFFDSVTVPGAQANGAQSLVITKSNGRVSPFTENLSNVSVSFTDLPTEVQVQQGVMFEDLASGFTDGTIDATLAGRMALADQSGPNFNVVDAEYEAKFIPGLREYIKKVK